jgi:glycosyltransferase involved in cell wall biosynthesis
MAVPAVSVLLPVRDAGPHLEASLTSLARQSLTGFEVVAVDDGSTDGSGAVLDRWAAEDPRVRVIHQGARGLVKALNRGLEHCRAPLVARMDADDVCHPKRLELQAELLASRPEVGVASCAVRHFPRHRIEQGFRLYEDWLNSLGSHRTMALQRFVESPVAHPSVMFHRALVAEAGGWRDAGWPEDYDLWLSLFEAGVVFEKVPRPLLFWRDHDARLTRIDPRYSTPSFLRCKAHYLARGPLADTKGTILWGAGQTGRRLSKFLREEGVAIDAVVDIDPAKIGTSLRGRPVIAPGSLPEHLGDGTVVLAAVASRGARELIRAQLRGMGLEEGRGFWCVA